MLLVLNSRVRMAQMVLQGTKSVSLGMKVVSSGTKSHVMGAQLSCYDGPNGVIRDQIRVIRDESGVLRNHKHRLWVLNTRVRMAKMVLQGTKFVSLGMKVVSSGKHNSCFWCSIVVLRWRKWFYKGPNSCH